MSHQPDLSQHPDPTVPDRVLAVGWLDPQVDFTRGEVATAVLDRLGQLAAHHTVRRTRGLYRCQLCIPPPDPSGRMPEPAAIEVDGRRVVLGAAEIWVRGTDGVFAAPDLIVHYIGEHEYRPPEVFLDAVVRGGPQGYGPS